MGEYETGICGYTVKHIVYIHTSGTELPGPQEKWGEFPSKLDAEIALANAEGDFTKGKYGWRGYNGYTEAYISRVVEYGPPLTPPAQHKETG